MNNKLGFTLIEMLTVIMIISILTAVVLPQYRRAVQRAQATEAIAMLRTINDSAERLAGEFGYRTFQSFSNGSDAAKATFQRMDMFGTDTISCTFNSDYTEMTCDKFKYFLNPGANYAYAQKLSAPYQGVEIRLSRGDLPALSCAGNATACDVYSLDCVSGCTEE